MNPERLKTNTDDKLRYHNETGAATGIHRTIEFPHAPNLNDEELGNIIHEIDDRKRFINKRSNEIKQHIDGKASEIELRINSIMDGSENLTDTEIYKINQIRRIVSSNESGMQRRTAIREAILLRVEHYDLEAASKLVDQHLLRELEEYILLMRESNRFSENITETNSYIDEQKRRLAVMDQSDNHLSAKS